MHSRNSGAQSCHHPAMGITELDVYVNLPDLNEYELYK